MKVLQFVVIILKFFISYKVEGKLWLSCKIRTWMIAFVWRFVSMISCFISFLESIVSASITANYTAQINSFDFSSFHTKQNKICSKNSKIWMLATVKKALQLISFTTGNVGEMWRASHHTHKLNIRCDKEARRDIWVRLNTLETADMQNI